MNDKGWLMICKQVKDLFTKEWFERIKNVPKGEDTVIKTDEYYIVIIPRNKKK